jgi:tetrahydromethanopterin S-methyltransferase subunit G
MEDKSFELLTKIYSEMNEKFDNIHSEMNQRFDSFRSEINKRFDIVDKKLDQKADKTDIVRLENELTPKIEVLFDGYKQHTDILERIEKQVSKQEEIIMRRVK